MRTFTLVCITVILFLLPESLMGQITASDSSGCAPLVNVSFTSPAGASGINWDFGDGTGSNLPSPVHTFTTPGTFTVLFTGTISGNPVNYSLIINVYGKPSSFFRATTAVSGCIPLTVNFKDSSFGGGGSAITAWEWSFGDGGINTANNPNPSYTYTIPGVFTVSLKVTDQNGCDTSISRINYVNTSAPPNAIITTIPSPPAACIPPLNVSFSGSSSSSNSPTGGGLTYLWNFGGGNTSTVVNPPVASYTNSGVFPVSLTVTDNNNCSATVTTNVVISAPVASFNAVGAVNDTVCPTVTFHNTSTGVSPFYTYGDGTTGTDSIHTYLPGTYQVTLQVQAGSCIDDTTITIIVENVTASFTSNPGYSCSWPFTVQHTNTSVNGNTWLWNFGDGTTSTVKNPVHTYQNPDTNMYTIYYEPWIYITTLNVTSVHGCTALFTATDSVFKPTARFMPDVDHGCAPLTVVFSDSSISNEPIVTRNWSFGDGGVNNGNNLTVSHTYTTPGVYYARLIITNSIGCKDTSYLVPVYVGEPPSPSFSVVPISVCVNTPVQFTDLTPPGDSAQYFHYTADGGYMSHCYNDPDPVWSFNHVTGPQNIQITTTYNGCAGSATITNAIDVKGPLAHFYTEGNCATPFTYICHGDIQDADYWTWNFGDGTVINNSTDPTPTHTYTSTGDFTITVTAYNNTSGCPPYVESHIVNVRNINASFGSDSLVCVGQSTIFNAASSQDVYGYCYEGYLWYWNDGTHPHHSELPSAQHIFQSGGDYQVKLVVKDINGCVDSVKRNISAYDIQAYFKPNKLYGCLPLTVNFTDSSFADTTITQWQWNFGDGSTSNQQNPSHVFTQTGVFYWFVQLVVTNALGCKDSITVMIRPSVPDSLFFVLPDSNICVGEQVSFIASSTIVTYQWNFGNGNSSTLYNPTSTYNNAGTYNVTLTVTDSIGCQSSSTHNAAISVQNYPIAGFFSSADTLFNKCYPLLVTFTDTSIVNIFGSRQWNLGNGTTTIPNQTVGTIYNAPGTFFITLIETTTNGCSDTITKSITTEGPVGNFDIFPDTICKGQAITFSIKDTADVLGYHWDFGDGTTAPGISPITHTFNINPVTGQTMVSLVMWSPDSACTATISNPIYIQPVIADFTTNNDSVFCLNEPVPFTNISQNATSGSWNFGDGQTYNGINPPDHTFPGPGVYTVTLVVSNASSGCSDTVSNTLTILGIPVAVATGGDTCQGAPVQIFASGGIGYSWSPTTGLSDSTIANPIASPDTTTDYTVTVYDANGCTDTATASVFIFEPAVEIHFDTLMVIGETTQLNVYTGAGYIYSWSPATGLSCTDCPDPIAQPLVNTVYSVTISDPAGCFSVTSTYEFEIKPITTIDVPTAFTPNGDGNNDLIFVDGLGIKRLIEFKIYNRWGQLMFETDDITKGWDGFYLGKLQNIETYVYFARVETWIPGRLLDKQGSFNLLR